MVPPRDRNRDKNKMEIETLKQAKFELDIKRFYFPFVVQGNCPKCGKFFKRDFNEDYISYPTVNEFAVVDFFHYDDESNTECEFELEMRLSFGAEIKMPPIGSEMR